MISSSLFGDLIKIDCVCVYLWKEWVRGLVIQQLSLLEEDDDMRARVCVCASVFEGSFGSYCQGQNELFISSVGGDTRMHTLVQQ